MTTGQTISIISAVIVSAFVVSLSVIMNTPTVAGIPKRENDQMNVKDGDQQSDNKVNTQKFNLKDIINSLTKN